MRIEPFQFLTLDASNYSHPEQARHACRAGVKWVQCRVKQNKEEFLSIARETVRVCHEYGAVCIINDDPMVARVSGADGVHLGLLDGLALEARQILGAEKIVGGSANSSEEVRYQLEQSADYVGVGPYRFTGSKKNLSPILGAGGIEKLVTHFPGVKFIAIGGIDEGDFYDLAVTGIYGVAVSSVIARDSRPEEKARRLLNAWMEIKSKEENGPVRIGG